MKPKIVYFDGTKVVDQKTTGFAAWDYRVAKRVKRMVLSGKMNMLESEVSKLESGKSKWTPELLAQYVAAVDALANAKP